MNAVVEGQVVATLEAVVVGAEGGEDATTGGADHLAETVVGVEEEVVRDDRRRHRGDDHTPQDLQGEGRDPVQDRGPFRGRRLLSADGTGPPPDPGRQHDPAPVHDHAVRAPGRDLARRGRRPGLLAEEAQARGGRDPGLQEQNRERGRAHHLPDAGAGDLSQGQGHGRGPRLWRFVVVTVLLLPLHLAAESLDLDRDREALAIETLVAREGNSNRCQVV